jgi:hypothetical protein
VAVSLTDLAAGHTFDPISFSVSAGMARAYREAVSDGQDSIYEASGNAVPPLAAAALALGALLQQVALPSGSLHAGESLDVQAAIPEGSVLECRARLAQRSVRAGWVVSVLETELLLDGASALSARATVLSPAES